MPIVSVPKNVWTTVVTASTDTLIENLGHTEVFISKSPQYTDPKKLTVTTVDVGETAYIYSVNKTTQISVIDAEGVQGPAGPQGPQGPQGPEGPPGSSDIEGANIDGGFF